MKYLKRLLSICVLAIIIVGSMFTMTACNLVVKDKSAYYNQTVATFEFDNKTIKVSMNDLNSAFASYGYPRYNQGNYTSMKDCINDSLTYHIQKTLLMNHIAKTLNEEYNENHNELYNLSFVDFSNYDWDKTMENIYNSDNPNALEIRNNAFEAMLSDINSYAEDILKDEDRAAEIVTEEKESIRDSKEEYESKLVIESVYVDNTDNGIDDGQYIKQVSKKVDTLTLFNKTNIAKHFELTYTYDKEVTDRAYNKYINILQQEANAQGRSTKIEDVLLYQENMQIQSAYQNKLLELYQYYYESNQEIDIDKIVEYYKNQYDDQLRSYEDNITAYREAMKNSKSDYIFYHNNSGNEYILVNHILIKFTEEQKAKKTELDNQLKIDKENASGNPTLLAEIEEKYNNNLINLVISTKSKFEIDGVEKEGYISDIITEISDYTNKHNLDNADIMSEKEILIQKAKNFEDMMYKYNEDTGNMNADFYYAVNVNEGVEDKWEAGFTEGAIELYNNYNLGDVLARPVVSSYGVHIMFYSGMAKNIVEPEGISTLSYETLINNTVNPASDKTIFEYLYDKVEKEDYYNNFVSSAINQMYNSANIKIDEYKFKNLWNN